MPGTADTVSILFGGDTSFGENYQEKYAAEGEENVLVAQGYDYSVVRLSPLLASCDLNILNLETPLTSIREIPSVGKDYYHYSHPVLASETLARHRVHAVSLANNHSMDYGSAALEETFRSLKANDIACFGAGKDLGAASAPYMKKFPLEGASFELAVFGVFEPRKSYERYEFYATEGSGGTCRLDVQQLKRQINELKRLKPNLFVVVFPHWGNNYVWRSHKQQSWGRQIIDAGADLIVGHGAHCLQQIECYKRRWIVYSIGNFVFNSRGRFNKLSAPPYSMPVVLHVEVNDGIPKKYLRFYPIVSDNTKTKYQPRFVTAAEFREVHQLLLEHSLEANLSEEMTYGKNEIANFLQLDIQPESE